MRQTGIWAGAWQRAATHRQSDRSAVEGARDLHDGCWPVRALATLLSHAAGLRLVGWSGGIRPSTRLPFSFSFSFLATGTKIVTLSSATLQTVSSLHHHLSSLHLHRFTPFVLRSEPAFQSNCASHLRSSIYNPFFFFFRKVLEKKRVYVHRKP